MLLQALRVEIEMKNLNLQVTFLVQKGVGTRSHTKKRCGIAVPTRDPTRGSGGNNAPGRHFSVGRHFWWNEGIANGFSRMNLKLDLGFRFWLRLDLPYFCPGLSRFKRLSRCPVPVNKMSRKFTSVKFSILTPAWWCIVMKSIRPERLDFALTRVLGRRYFSTVGSGVT